MSASKPAGAYELAQLIYIELVARNTEVKDGAVKMAAPPAALAALSMKLADAFSTATDEADNAKAGAITKKADAPDVGAWMK